MGGEAQQERIYNVLNVQLYKMYKTFLSCFHVTMNTAYKFIFFKVVFFSSLSSNEEVNVLVTDV